MLRPRSTGADPVTWTRTIAVDCWIMASVESCCSVVAVARPESAQKTAANRMMTVSLKQSLRRD
jgi:hypothetical protein